MLKVDLDLKEPDILKLGIYLTGDKTIDNNFEKALEFFRTAAKVYPNCADAWSNMGVCFLNLKKPALALEPLRKGLALAPNHPALHLHYGVALQVCLHLDEGREHLLRALALNPPFCFEVWCSLSINSQYRADIKQAISEYEMALKLQPGNNIGEQSMGMMMMLDRQWDAGLNYYEARLKALNPWIPIPTPHYDHAPDKSFSGKKVLVLAEQGIGDGIQFLRYFPYLKSLYPDSVFTNWCDDKLADLSKVFGVPTVHPAMKYVPATDYQIPILSLMKYLNDKRLPFIIPEWNPFPAPEKKEWHRIGFCWRGNPLHNHDLFRSISWDIMRNIVQRHQSFDEPASVCLQADATEDEKACFDYVPTLDSWMATASLIQRLDCVVTVDTAVAHLAGTLGVPCYVLMAKIVDWRWGLEGETTEWYKSLRLYRQTKLGDWGPVVERVLKALREKEYLCSNLVAANQS